ncbi:MAG: hypothetical protein H7832_03625 [Magnetococcus sp. DMHC-6]
MTNSIQSTLDHPMGIAIPQLHTILLMDGGVQEGGSSFFQAVMALKIVAPFGHSLQLLHYPLRHCAQGENLSKLRGVLRLEKGIVGDDDQRLVRLRAVVLAWDALPEPLEVCRLLRFFHPDLSLFILHNSQSNLDMQTFTRQLIGAPPLFYTDLANSALFAHLLEQELNRIIHSYYEAPYWDSLKRFTQDPLVSFHTLPIGRGQSCSPSYVDFAAYYNEYFDAETSLATSPLDSLLMPKEAIKKAQLKAASAFGAGLAPVSSLKYFGTRFVTCGTSSANRVVISAFVKPDDYVMLELSCHVSHHYSLAYTHAKPIYLEIFSNMYGIAGPTPLAILQRELEGLLERENRLPAMLILTNPTFDGFYYRPMKVVATVRTVLAAYWEKYRHTARFTELLNRLYRFNQEVDLKATARAATPHDFIVAALRGIVFLFDEAWSADAFFHPRFIEFTAMHAALHGALEGGDNLMKGLRIYSTHSIHKRLSALRQGSMIHYRDPLMELAEFRIAFEQSYRSNTTTSPSANIIASLDVARRQAQLEGEQLIEESIQLAEKFRRDYERPPGGRGRHSFYVVSAEEMMKSADPDRPDLSPDDFFFDTTRVTLSWDFAIAGKKIRQLLLNNAIHINKYGQKVVLIIFNIGIDSAHFEQLRHVLETLASQLQNEHVCLGALENTVSLLTKFSGFYGTENLGYWAKNLGLKRLNVIDVEDICQTIEQTGSLEENYISAAFVIPYPPGYPLLVPGQLITAQLLNCLRGFTSNDVLGAAERTDDRLMIATYVVHTP